VLLLEHLAGAFTDVEALTGLPALARPLQLPPPAVRAMHASVSRAAASGSGLSLFGWSVACDGHTTLQVLNGVVQALPPGFRPSKVVGRIDPGGKPLADEFVDEGGCPPAEYKASYKAPPNALGGP
jgi:hypothetical protein